jgi:hypothetical protein
MKDKYNLRCSKCGSTNIYVKGDALFSIKKQQWEFYPDPDYEASCGGGNICKDAWDSRAEMVKVGSDRDKELITIDEGNQL